MQIYDWENCKLLIIISFLLGYHFQILHNKTVLITLAKIVKEKGLSHSYIWASRHLKVETQTHRT